MKYQVLDAPEARRIISAGREGVEERKEPTCGWRGDGDELDTSFIEVLRRKMSRLQEAFPGKRSDKQNSDFEAEAAVIVHELVPYETGLLADFGFWTWLAVIHLPTIVEWRYATPDKAADLKNYGIGARGENFLYRLWLRGEISLDERAADPYHLTRRGQVDFWRSHLFRQGYACVPTMARALIQFQYPDELSGTPKLKIAEIRALAPRMKRLRANLMYEFLDEGACLKLLERESSRITGM